MVKKKTTRRKTTRKTTKKASGARKSTRKTTRKATPAPKAPWELLKGKGDVVAINVPWGASGMFTSRGAKYVPGFGYVAPRDKAESDSLLAAYSEKPYSWKDYVVQRAAGVRHTPSKTLSTGEFTLRPDQVEDRDIIVSARDNGAPEALVASGTGVGKTVTTVAAVNAMDGDTVLVVCPKAVIPGWRTTLDKMGDSGKQWVIVNYESLMPLMKPPASALNAKKTATKNKNTALHGTPWFVPDIVVTDEAHKTRNPTSQQTRIVDKFVDKANFTIRLTATPGENPAQLHWLRRGLSWSTGDDFVIDDDYSGFIQWCERNGVHGVKRAKFGNGVDFSGSESDTAAMNNIIFNSEKQWALIRQPEGWPEQKRNGVPIDLDPEAMIEYEKEWELFKKTVIEQASSSRVSAAARSKARAKGLAALTRYRQKVGVLKCQPAFEYAKECLDGGEHIVFSCVFKDTVRVLSDILTSHGIDHAVMTGENPEERETERLRFQTGEVPVAITSVTTGISLHEGEKALGDDADNHPRRMIVVEPQWSAVETQQLFGRVHRDGEDAPASIIMASGTIDEKVTSVLLRKINSMSGITGAKSDAADILKELGLPGEVLDEQ